MTSRLKKQKIISLTLLLYSLFVIFIGDHIPIEFTNSTFKNIYYILIYLSLPASFIWAMIVFFNVEESAIFATITATISLAFLLFVGLFHTMCGISTEVILKNKNSSETIVRRSFGCGAYDSDMSVYTFHKVVPMTPLFNIVTKIDITTIDKNIWTTNVKESRIVDYYEKAALAKAAADKAAADKAKQNNH